MDVYVHYYRPTFGGLSERRCDHLNPTLFQVNSKILDCQVECSGLVSEKNSCKMFCLTPLKMGYNPPSRHIVGISLVLVNCHILARVCDHVVVYNACRDTVLAAVKMFVRVPKRPRFAVALT